MAFLLLVMHLFVAFSSFKFFSDVVSKASSNGCLCINIASRSNGCLKHYIQESKTRSLRQAMHENHAYKYLLDLISVHHYLVFLPTVQ